MVCILYTCNVLMQLTLADMPYHGNRAKCYYLSKYNINGYQLTALSECSVSSLYTVQFNSIIMLNNREHNYSIYNVFFGWRLLWLQYGYVIFFPKIFVINRLYTT